MFENLPKRVYLREVGPRDGLQNEPNFVPTDVKKEFIRRLADTGLPHIEITSFVHPKWIPALADSAEIGAAFAAMPKTHTSALVPNIKGLEGAEKAGVKEVAVFMSASESHNKANINRTIKESLAQFEELIPTIKSKGMRVIGSVSVVFGCPFEGEVKPEQVVPIAKSLLDFGSDYISLGDTIGVGTPTQMKRLLEKLLPITGPKRLGIHLHDTQSTALANAVAALEMGITAFDGSVGGLGGCPYAPGASGNVPTESLVYMFEGMGISTGVDLNKLLEVGVWIQEKLGHPLMSSGLRAYIGRKARAAEKASGAAGM
jgi:hydroxymethylglutaryl-CoA lyase